MRRDSNIIYRLQQNTPPAQSGDSTPANIPYGPQLPPEELGHNEAIKEVAKEEDKFEKKLSDLAHKSNNILCHIYGVFPFDFFPNEVIIDLAKVSIVFNSFLSRRVHSIFLKDIADVFVDDGILFASLNIVDLGFSENMLMVNYLDKPDAHHARRIIEGLVISAKQDIDLSKIAPERLHDHLNELGQVKLID